jgi:outer membrane protein TolC
MKQKPYILRIFAGFPVLLLILVCPLPAIAQVPGSDEKVEASPSRAISLEEVLRRALEKNFDIELARLDQKISLLSLPAARSVYDTLLTAELNYNYDNFKKSSQYQGDLSKIGNYGLEVSKLTPWGTTFSLGFANQYNYTDSAFTILNPSTDSYLKASLTQPLLKNWGGMQTRGKIELVGIEVDNINLSAWQGMELSLAEAARIYWDLVEIQTEVRLEEKMEERARYLFELSQRQLKMGMVEQVDLVATEANLKIRESELIFDRERLVTVSRRLKYLIDDRSPELILPADILALPSDPAFASFPESMTLALENRWDYLRAIQELQAGEINLDLKENSLWPQVDLVASFARNGLSDTWSTAAGEIFDENNPRYYAGLQFSYFLEDRLAGSEFQQAELEKARALIMIKKIEREIYTQVDEQLRTSRVSLDLAGRENYIQALQQEKLSEEEKRFKYGRSNSKTVIDYQNDLLLSQLNANKALTVYYKSLIDLQVVQGVFLRRQLGAEVATKTQRH